MSWPHSSSLLLQNKKLEMAHRQAPADDREFDKCSHSRTYSPQAGGYETPSED